MNELIYSTESLLWEQSSHQLSESRLSTTVPFARSWARTKCVMVGVLEVGSFNHWPRSSVRTLYLSQKADSPALIHLLTLSCVTVSVAHPLPWPHPFPLYFKLYSIVSRFPVFTISLEHLLSLLLPETTPWGARLLAAPLSIPPLTWYHSVTIFLIFLLLPLLLSLTWPSAFSVHVGYPNIYPIVHIYSKFVLFF